MTACEMCGNDVKFLTRIKIENSSMLVCNFCKPLGKEDYTTNKTHTFKKIKRSRKPNYDVVSNYAQIIQSSLSKKGLNVKQLARVTNIKESSLNNYLKGSIKLDIETAKKIQKFLETNLVYECENDSDVKTEDFINDESPQKPSLGDLIQKQLNKNK